MLRRLRPMLLALSLVVPGWATAAQSVPDGFVDVGQTIPGVVIDARYAGHENFMGRPVRGYHAGKVFLSREAAAALAVVQRQLAASGMALKLFDGYRPQRAVDDFMAWTQDASDTAQKQIYYPHVAKDRLVPDGYIAAKSGHSRGSTIDLTIVRLHDGGEATELDMGSPWDFFGPVSHPSSTAVSEEARTNRMLLRVLMIGAGFKPLEEEWWHFTLRDEPYPDTYFDFPVE